MRSPPATGFGPTLETAEAARMPAEFEPIDALMLGVNELIEYHPETLAEIVAALDGDTGIVALVSQPDQEQRTLDLLRDRGIANDGIRFFTWPAESMWVQDFGPQQFPNTCPDLDREALEVYRRVFPDRRIVGIDVSKIIGKRGGLHCLSLSIPRLPGTG